MSRLRHEIFLDLPPNLLCPVCKGVLDQPVITTCGHTFCQVCIRARKECPECKKSIAEPFAGNKDLAEVIGNIDVVCEFSEFPSDSASASPANNVVQKPVITHCTWRGKYKNLNGHLLEQCNHSSLNCPNSGCTFKGVRGVLTQHVTLCGYRKVKCEWCGNDNVAVLEKKTHEDGCPEKKISCILECGAEMKRKDYPLHRRKSCPNNYTNIHIKGFNESISEAELVELFKTYGEIIHLKLVEQGIKKNKYPYCFVCFKTPESAHTAQTALHSSNWKKRTIYISKAVTPWNIWSEYRKKYSNCCIYIRNIPPEVTEEALASTFADFGFIFATHIVLASTADPAVKLPTGGAYVCFDLSTEADKAVEHCKENEIFGKKLTVQKYVPEEERKAFHQKQAKQYGGGHSHYNWDRPAAPNQYDYYGYQNMQYPSYAGYYPGYYMPQMMAPTPPPLDVIFLYHESYNIVFC